MNSQEKEEILKSVEAALSEDDATVAAALANLGLYAEDER
jgi:hypothetical protein